MTERGQFAPNEALFELAGPTSSWLWAHTCPRLKCPCRSAFVLATSAGSDILLERTAAVRRAPNPGAEYARLASGLDNVVAFDVDIDAGVVVLANGNQAPGHAEHADVGAIVDRLDGDLLDALGHLWLRGKGLPSPERARLGSTVAILGWQPGDAVAWSDVFGAVREDLYRLDGRVYQASEMYCVVPTCDCGDVVVQFETRRPRGGPPQGRVIVPRSGEPKIEPSKNGSERLERLWTAFQHRHPNCVQRFASRCSRMKTTGFQVVAKPASSKARRGCPSPCGSGANGPVESR